MPNPSDDDLSIPALLSETASAVLTAQRVLNHEIRPTLPEAESGTRFWMTSIPRIEVSWKISLITRKDKKLFFIPQGHKTDRLLHVISLLFSAVPAAPEPLAQSVPLESEPLPLVLLEPPFLVNERESNRVCETLVAALREGRWRG